MAESGPALVTGATGFAGSHLIDHLLEHEPRVLAWSNPRGRPRPASHDGRVEWTAVDILDRAAVTRALAAARPSAIYHCAGSADVHGAWKCSGRTLQVNAMGTFNLLQAAVAAGVDCPVLVTGSALVYRPSSEALTEDSPLEPSGPYAVSKLAQEMVADAAAGQHVLLTRAFNHAGPRQSDAYATASFAHQIAGIEAGLREPVLRVGNLDSRRDITDVRDVVRAYRTIVVKGRPHTPYNVCSGTAYRVGDLLERLLSQAKMPVRVEQDPARLRPSDNPIVLGSYARLEADTGWRPLIPIERTLADLLEYCRAAAAGRRPASR